MNSFDVANFQNQRRSAFGADIFYYDEVDSTNRIAESMARKSFREGTVVLANSQTTGRGRNSNQWFSPKEKNLYFTLLLKPTAENLHRTAFIAALAASRALSEYDLVADLKWPNDILIGSRKIGGILIQSAMEGGVLQYAVVGVGINVNITEFPPDLRPVATSIALEIGNSVSKEQLLSALLFEFESLYAKMNETSWEDFVQELEMHSSYLKNCTVEIKTPDGITEGVTAGLDQFGGLILKTAEGQTVVYSGEVKACRKKGKTF